MQKMACETSISTKCKRHNVNGQISLRGHIGKHTIVAISISCGITLRTLTEWHREMCS